MDTIIAYSDKSLRISIKAGFTMVCFLPFYILYLTYRKSLLHIPLEEWTSLMVLLWFLGGLAIANLHIIGIYRGKVFNEKKCTLYAISRKLNV